MVAVIEIVNASCFTFAVSDIMALTWTSEADTPLKNACLAGQRCFYSAVRRDFNARIVIGSWCSLDSPKNFFARGLRFIFFQLREKSRTRQPLQITYKASELDEPDRGLDQLFVRNKFGSRRVLHKFFREMNLFGINSFVLQIRFLLLKVHFCPTPFFFLQPLLLFSDQVCSTISPKVEIDVKML
jgi:hypothetical protein